MDDPRVTARGGGWSVDRGNGDVVEVLHTETFGWTICAGPDLNFVATTGGGFAIRFLSAEAAVEAALA